MSHFPHLFIGVKTDTEKALLSRLVNSCHKKKLKHLTDFVGIKSNKLTSSKSGIKLLHTQNKRTK